MNFSQPTLVDGQLYVPSEWCEKMKDRTMCMCDDKHDTVVSDINDVGLTSELALDVDYYTEGVLLPVICAVGIFGNIASILVLTNKEIDLKPSFVNILICLAFYDLLFEILAVLMYSLPNLSLAYKDSVFPFFLPYLLPLIHIALTGSVYTTIAVAVERCITVLAPFTSIKSFHGFLYLCPIILFSILYNIPKFFEVQTRCSVSIKTINSSEEAHWVSDKYAWDKSDVRSHPKYMTYITANCVVMGLLPMFLLSVLNCLIFRAVSRAHAHHASLMSSHAHRRDSTMATVLTTIVLIFVVCHTPKAVLNMYEIWTHIFTSPVPEEEDINLLLDILTNISHLLIVTNSAVNIVVYVLKDFKFRQVLWSFFCGPKPRFLRNNTLSYKCSQKVGKGNNGVAASNFTNMVDVTNHDSQDSENKVLQTDF